MQLRSSIDALNSNIFQLYANAKLLDDSHLVDFHVRLAKPKGIRQFIRPQINFMLDQNQPFKPLPLDQTCAFFEWGLNWTIAQHAMHYLIIHCAVVAKDDLAIILPGMPGAGKSTLCAAICHHGWRLLSDEQALISLETGLIEPLARPICLKNESIDIIKEFCPSAEFGAIVAGTSKGVLAHVKAPADATEQLDIPAQPRFIIFPQFDATVDQASLTPVTQGMALIELIGHCFNYTTLGEQGFSTLTNLVTRSQCFEFRYRELSQALDIFNRLHLEKSAP